MAGNKCDLDDSKRCVTKEEGKMLATDLGGKEGLVSFAETSAKTNVNVYEVFADLVRRQKAARDVLANQTPKGGGCCNLL